MQTAADDFRIQVLTLEDVAEPVGQDEEGVWNGFRLRDGSPNGCQNAKKGSHLFGVAHTPVHNIACRGIGRSAALLRL